MCEHAMIKTVLRVICIGAAVLGSAAASAQDFPSKPIRLIVPFPPGGPNDLIARVVGQKMSELLKQQVVIDNRGGAGGVIGTDVVAKAAPDGHTIAITSAGALAISIALQEKLPYDTLKHLKPVTLVATVPELLVAATSLPANNLNELIALARAKPGTLNYASSGPGSMPHLAGELLKVAAKVDIVHVPYKGAAPAVNDLLGQQVQMAFFDLPVLLPQVQAGKLKAIVVGSKQRAPSLKDVPTTAELASAGRGRQLVRHGRADCDAARDRRAAASGDSRGAARRRRAREAVEPGPHAGRRHARAVHRLYPRRDREVGQGGEGREADRKRGADVQSAVPMRPLGVRSSGSRLLR